jgi:hypothetical protein
MRTLVLRLKHHKIFLYLIKTRVFTEFSGFISGMKVKFLNINAR